MQATTLLKIIIVFAVVVTISVFLTKDMMPLPMILSGTMHQKDSLPHAGKMAEIELEAKKLINGVARVTDEMMRFEGIISQKEINGEKKTAWLMIKLPSAELENAVKTLEQIGGLKHSRLTTEDKTESCMKLQTQLESLQESKERLLSISSSESYKKLPEMLQVENKLRDTEKKMGEIKREMERLEDQTAYGLIFIRMYEKKIPLSYETAFQNSTSIACRDGLDNCIRILGIIIFWALSSMPLVAVFLILWLIAALFQIKGIGRKLRHKKNTVGATPCGCPPVIDKTPSLAEDKIRVEPLSQPSSNRREEIEKNQTLSLHESPSGHDEEK
ncbi:DUF4349 domain-containing protein [Candidatus Desantisbacteria bacterium]|nr:DUF4349 domain-containing protein [Candidatus Desantisbacteria bacterium]